MKPYDIEQFCLFTALDKKTKIIFSDSCKLEAQLHNMLICSPSHSFDFHQDSKATTNLVVLS